jgi:copper homeostasis protein
MVGTDGLIVEACVDSPASAERARAAGADRIELCAALEVGGTTPSMADVAVCVERTSLPVHVMIRPRDGGFVYDALELSRMRRDIERARAAGAAALVLGVLDRSGRVDVERTRELVECARPLPVTFHRAFDVASDPDEALDDVIAAGATRLLTAGGAARAAQGIASLARLVAGSGAALEVMAGGGVRAPNVERIVRATGVRAIHARCDPAEGDAFERLVAVVVEIGADA